jgi:hypothetical protein
VEPAAHPERHPGHRPALTQRHHLPADQDRPSRAAMMLNKMALGLRDFRLGPASACNWL